MAGGVKGDAYGGHYDSLVSDKVPRDKAAPGLGIWSWQKCGNVTCWSCTEASGKPRMDRITADNVQEVAMFRLLDIKGQDDPADWWWPLLDKFTSTPLYKPTSEMITI